MTMSVDMQRAFAFATDYEKDLRADDMRFAGSVLIMHEDGSIFRIQEAFAVTWTDPDTVPEQWGASEHPGTWVFVFSQCHQTLLFPLDDLYSVECLGPRKSPMTINAKQITNETPLMDVPRTFLSVRAKNALHAVGVKVVNDVRYVDLADLERMPRVGHKTMREVRALLMLLK